MKVKIEIDIPKKYCGWVISSDTCVEKYVSECIFLKIKNSSGFCSRFTYDDMWNKNIKTILDSDKEKYAVKSHWTDRDNSSGYTIFPEYKKSFKRLPKCKDEFK